MSVRIGALAALFLIWPILLAGQAPSHAPAADSAAIACRALETHTDDEQKVTAVVFHQRDEAQRAHLAALLREHSGEIVELQTRDGGWRRVRWFRLKSCFGRGLLLVPAPAPFPERAEFVLRLPAGSEAH
jgi:hypothetical protein